MKVGEAVAYWYIMFRALRHQETTAVLQWNYIRNHIKPSVLGQMRLEDARTEDYQHFLAGLARSGNKTKLPSIHTFGNPLSAWTVAKIRQLLVATNKWAVREGLISRNYAEDTETIRYKNYSNTFSVFTLENQKRFLERTIKHRFHFAYVLFFYTGCRRAELLGLTWDNVFLEDQYINIRNTLIMLKGAPVFKINHAKNDTSLRSIPIPAKICEQFKKWREFQNKEKETCPEWNNLYNLVFTNSNGSPVNPSYFSRNFKNAAKLAGLPSDIHLHCTRHTWATNMLQSGVPISDVQALGGWSSPDILLNIYSHSFHDSQRKAMDTMFNAVSSMM